MRVSPLKIVLDKLDPFPPVIQGLGLLLLKHDFSVRNCIRAGDVLGIYRDEHSVRPAAIYKALPLESASLWEAFPEVNGLIEPLITFDAKRDAQELIKVGRYIKKIASGKTGSVFYVLSRRINPLEGDDEGAGLLEDVSDAEARKLTGYLVENRVPINGGYTLSLGNRSYMLISEEQPFFIDRCACFRSYLPALQKELGDLRQRTSNLEEEVKRLQEEAQRTQEEELIVSGPINSDMTDIAEAGRAMSRAEEACRSNSENLPVTMGRLEEVLNLFAGALTRTENEVAENGTLQILNLHEHSALILQALAGIEAERLQGAFDTASPEGPESEPETPEVPGSEIPSGPGDPDDYSDI